MVGASLMMQVLEIADIEPVHRFVVLGVLDLAFLAIWIRYRSDLMERARLQFFQDKRRELLGHADGPAVYLYPETLTRAQVASLALSFPCLPAGYREESVPSDTWNRLLTSDVSIIQSEHRPVPAGFPVFRIHLDPSGFLCHPDKAGPGKPADDR